MGGWRKKCIKKCLNVSEEEKKTSGIEEEKKHAYTTAYTSNGFIKGGDAVRVCESHTYRPYRDLQGQMQVT